MFEACVCPDFLRVNFFDRVILLFVGPAKRVAVVGAGVRCAIHLHLLQFLIFRRVCQLLFVASEILFCSHSIDSYSEMNSKNVSIPF